MGADERADGMKAAARAWEEAYESEGRKSPEFRPEVTSTSGFPIKPLYTPSDVEGMDYLRDLGYPGQYPYTRGIYATMHRGRRWTMRTITGWGSPEATRERFKYLLGQGGTGINFHPDVPSEVGYDSDDPMAQGQVGLVGTPISTLADMEETFRDIPIDRVSVSIIVNATAPIILAMYVAMAEKRGIPLEQLQGSLQNDMLKEYEFTGTGYMVEPDGALKMSMDIVEYCTRHLPRWNTVTFCAYVARDHGMSAAAELGIGMANARWYIRQGIQRGLDVNKFTQRFSLFCSSHINLFEEAAKFRAARRMWARMLKEEFGATDPKAMRLRISCHTAGSSLTHRQPLNNLARLTLETLAAVLGGLQSISVAGMDEAISLPTEEAQMLSLRIQQIIAHESGAADTIDPLAGSYYVEALTNTLEEKAREYVEQIEAQGGALEALKRGFFDQERMREEIREVDDIEQGRRTLVGINAFQVEEDELPIKVFRGGPAYEEQRKEALARFRRERDQEKVTQALEAVEAAIKRDENLIPVLVEAVKANATLGEISRVLKAHYGVHRPAFSAV